MNVDLIYLHNGPIRGRRTDTDGSGETPHPSTGPDGIGGPTTPSVILIRYGWGLYQKKKNDHPYGWYKCLETPHPSSAPDSIGKWAKSSVDRQAAPLPQKRMRPLCILGLCLL
jgi:hypothetical protein